MTRKITDEFHARARLFLRDLDALCKKHSVCLSHEDGHGSFEVDDAQGDEGEGIRSASAFQYMETCVSERVYLSDEDETRYGRK